MLLAALIFTVIFPLTSQAQEIVVGINQAYELPTADGARIDVLNKGLVTLKDFGSRIIITGKKLGATELRVGKETYRIVVIHQKLLPTYQQLGQWISQKRGPQLHITPQNITLKGRLLVAKDFVDLLKYTNKDSSFTNHLTADRQLQLELEKHLQEYIQQHNEELGTLAFLPHWHYSVNLKDQKRLAKYQDLLAPYGITVSANVSGLSQRPMIQLQLYICHASSRFFRHYGLQWPGVATAHVVGDGVQSTLNYAFDLSAHFLEQQGLAKVLASPRLVTQSHHPANFHSGGEFPIIAPRSLFAQVEWKKHGILLQIEPKVDAKHHMQIKIKAEISLLDQSNAINGIPAIDKSSMDTTFFLEESRPIVLSGLINQRWLDNREGLPLLSQIPVLSSLFSHQQNMDSQTDVVFIVVPTIL